MKRRANLVSRFLIGAVMLCSVLALSIGSSATVGFCDLCSGQCIEESQQVYNNCRANGGSAYTCDQQRSDYNWNCHLLFCNGCPVIY